MKHHTPLPILFALTLIALEPHARAAENWSVGLSTSGVRIEATMVSGASAQAPTVLLIGGIKGSDASVEVVRSEAAAYEKVPQNRRGYRLLAIPLANPDAAALAFPPSGAAFRENAEANALWRWTALQSADLVLIAGADDFGFAVALSSNSVAGLGTIPAKLVPASAGLLKAVPRDIAPSDAHREIQRRQARSPRQVAAELLQVYGLDFDQVTYLPGMALIARMRMGQSEDVAQLAAPYLTGAKDSLSRANAQTLAAHLVFAEFAERTSDARATQLVKRTADLGFTETGEMKESMPLHDEMSDSVFMAIPILAKAAKLTGDGKYLDMAARHLSFMQKLDLRPDGLYRHSPLAEAAWGRGNAFPALGLALALTDFPKDHPQYNRILKAYQDHMLALAKFQDENGMWREVVDYPGAYSEFTATAMIGTAVMRGIHNGWLDGATYQPTVDRAWKAVSARTGADGRLINVCESTGKQRSLSDYLKRAAILGKDARGGGMALIFATEMAGFK